MLWTNLSKEIDDLLQEIQTKGLFNPVGARNIIDELHSKYLAGINERKCLEHVQSRYTSLKHEMQNIVTEFENMFYGAGLVSGKFGMECGSPDRINEHDDNSSVSSKSSRASTSSRKKSLKRTLVSRMKLDLAKARAREETEAAWLAYEHRQKMELRCLEEEARLAQLQWKIETQYDENAQALGVVSPMFAPTFLVDKQPHSTPFISLPTDGSQENPTTVQPVPGVVGPIEASTCLADKKLDSTPLNSISVSVPDEQPSKQTTATGTPASGTSKPQDSVTTQRDLPARQPDTSNPISEMCPPQPPRPVLSVQSAVGDEIIPLHHIPYQGPIPSITAVLDTVNVPDCVASHKDPSPRERNMPSSIKGMHWPQTSQSFRVAPSRCTSGEDCAPRDPTAAMWKVQLLSGIKPVQCSGNSADFPFFEQQIQTHLESDLLTDVQRIEYLPKFVTGEALEVVKGKRAAILRIS